MAAPNVNVLFGERGGDLIVSVGGGGSGGYGGGGCGTVGVSAAVNISGIPVRIDPNLPAGTLRLVTDTADVRSVLGYERSLPTRQTIVADSQETIDRALERLTADAIPGTEPSMLSTAPLESDKAKPNWGTF